MMRTLIFLACLFFASVASAQERVPLVIETAAGARHAFQVEIADDDQERAQGLMYRETMAPEEGMLFVFDRPRRITMWMQNTPLPLDMLFLDRDGRVVDLYERAVPFSTDTIAARRRAKFVLEVVGGTVDRLGIARGDRVKADAIGSGS
ncbi:MAG: DUF192 domain-containing protein [Alphaproteobacteria bacterium]|nr:DUF192 domain-containing protein [Alphaproteobacteria bacterium]